MPTTGKETKVCVCSSCFREFIGRRYGHTVYCPKCRSNFNGRISSTDNDSEQVSISQTEKKIKAVLLRRPDLRNMEMLPSERKALGL